MKPIRRQFTSDYRFPFHLVYRDTKSSQSELPDHLHDWFELIYVYRGKGTIFIDQTFYEMEQGDWFIVPGNTIHRAFPDQENPVTSTAVFFSSILLQQSSWGDSFSYLQCFEQAKKRRAHKIPSTESQRQMFERYLEDTYQECQLQNPGYRHAILLHLQRILLEINREMVQGSQGPGSTVGPVWMKEILLYIDEHTDANLSLPSLSQRASVNPSHFCRVFKQLTGMNVTEYVNTKRIIRAGDLLLSTDNSISTIASMCGIETLPHFHRMFKKVTGMTPAIYRKNQRAAQPKILPSL
jgi:AraC-like DNA-binding protein